MNKPKEGHAVVPSSALEASNRRAFSIGMVVVILSLLSGLATFLITTNLTPIAPTHYVVLYTLGINILLILVMVGVVTWQLIKLRKARKADSAGSRLHVRIVALFAVIAILPTIVLAIFATLTLDRGLDQLFSSRFKSLISNSFDVARAYVNEHGNVIRADAIGMATALDKSAPLLKTDPKKFREIFLQQARRRGLPTVYLIDGQGKIVGRALRDKTVRYLKPDARFVDAAKQHRVVIIAPAKTNKVRAIIQLQNFKDTFLYVLRTVDPEVIKYLQLAKKSVTDYQALEARRASVQVAFGLVYLTIALTFLLAAIWLGLWFASFLVSPIRRLISAAKQVSSGDLDVQLKVRKGEDDVDQLSVTFNNMTQELKNQRNDLVNANTMLDDRRRFTEAVLSGVTAGVLGLDQDGKVNLANRSALQLLSMEEDAIIGRHLSDAVTEFASLLERATKDDDKRLIQDQINIFRDGRERNLAVRVTKEQAGTVDHGVVVTFDDVTDLVSAQRTSAWADVAQRIAHEIKNPLTPIQLSAERIRRKYGKSISGDREVFDKCTETIIRQVGDIGRMVDEFSSFARMPKPEMEEVDIGKTVKEAVFLLQVARPEITFKTDVPDEPIISLFDRRLMSQAVTNLVKNATEAISARSEMEGPESGYKGRILTRVEMSDKHYTIEVIDNGCGLPKKDRNRLVEPYMTTREKGTGLGLAIVQKITEQHGGTLYLEDAPEIDGRSEGACVRLSVPITVQSNQTEAALDGEPNGQSTTAVINNSGNGAHIHTANAETDKTTNHQENPIDEQGASDGV